MRRVFTITMWSIFSIVLTACGGSPATLDLDQEQTNVPSMQTESPVGEDIDLANLFAPFWESWSIIHDEFVSQPVDDEVMLAGAIAGLTLALEELDISLEELPDDMDEDVLETVEIKAKTPRNVEKLFLPFWHLWTFGVDAVMESGMTYETLMQSALHGMVDSLGDPHTFYVDPDQYRQLNIPLEGEYEGIGAWVDTTGDYLTIITPMEGSPAEQAGLRFQRFVSPAPGECFCLFRLRAYNVSQYIFMLYSITLKQNSNES